MTQWREEISEPRDDCGGKYGFRRAYLIEADDATCKLTVTVRIHLDPDSGVSTATLAQLQQRWKTAIEARWSGRYKLRLFAGECRCANYEVAIQVQWLNQPGRAHHTVNLREGSGRENAKNWYVNSADNPVCHELGHLLGLRDEYADPKCPTRWIGDPGSIMRDNSRAPQPSHYDQFATWLSRKSSCSYTSR